MIAFLLGALLGYQNNNDIIYNEELQVNYVLLDVLVTDRKGNLVADLKPSDFEVKENRKKVDITYFDTLDYRSDRKPNLADIPEEYQNLVETTETQQIIFAMDLEAAPLLEAKRAFKQMRDFLGSLEQEEGKSYSVNFYGMDRGSITKGFVSNFKVAIEALNAYEQQTFDAEMEKRSTSSTGGSLLLPDHDPGWRPPSSSTRPNTFTERDNTRSVFEKLEREFRDCGFFSGRGGQSSRCINDVLDAFIREQEFRTERVIGELEILTEKFEDEKGLKMMLLVSPGFALSYVNSAFDLARAYINGGDSLIGGSSLAGKLDIRRDFRRVLHACIRNRVVFHTFDIFNHSSEFNRAFDISSGGAPAAAVRRAYRDYRFEITEGLRVLAEESGGSFFQTGTLQGPMKKVLGRNRFFYVLGYDSPDGKPGEYRKIKIKIKRRGVKLRYRTGYFGS